MNQYHIYEAIGRGKHSTVYKGRKKKTIEYYAIKSVDKSQKNRVLQEVRTLHSLDHSNVLKFHAWYETSAHLWLVLEYCVGGDLLTLLRQDTRLPEESIHDFARDLVNALQFLHSKGVIYCDLKPSNILLDENGRLKLCDFGLARRLSDIAKSSVQQLPQAKRGTPCYMAPELFQDGGVHSFASDLWALGCVMYECYAGKPPFVSNSFTQLVNSILADPTPSLHGSPSREFEDLVMSLLIKDPAKRLQWPEICQHPFWRAKLKLLMFPPQPAFARFLQQSNVGGDSAVSQGTSVVNAKNTNQDQNNRRLDAHSGLKKASTASRDTESCENVPSSKQLANGKATNIRSTTPLKEDLGQTNRGVNLLRLSKIVKTNLQRETEGGNYRQQGQNVHMNGEDVMIENNDLELDFAEQTEGDSNDEEDVPDMSASRESSAAENDKGIPSNNEKEQPSKVQIPSSNVFDRNGRNDIDHAKGELEKAQAALARLDVAATPPGVGIPRRMQRTQTHSDQKKILSNSPAQGNGEPLKTTLVISQALWHPSDLAVRPIMVCKKIDKLAELGYDIRSLPCDVIAPADFIKLSSEEVESVANKIVASISSGSALNEKLNTLKYLETLCSNVDCANVLINGPVMYTLVKMLRTTKPPALRIQVIYTMGLLIRHATLIEEELANTGIITVLSEGLRDKQDKVRRCSMATLGELLFYIATQNEGSPRSTAGCDPTKDAKFVSPWQVPSTLIALIASILRKGEDDATQHYAVKTIENISSQGGEWAARFTNQGVLENLCYIFKASGKQESLRLTAGSCLVRLLRFNASNAPFVLEKLSMKELSMGLSKPNLKEQQVNVNLLNIFLSMPVSNAKQLSSLLEEKSLISNLLTILEQSTEVLRGKALVCAALLCKVNRRWLASFCSSKLLAIIERLTKEKDCYVRQCIDALIQTIVDLVPNILDSIGSDVQQPGGGKRISLHTSRHPVRSSLALLPIILHLFESPVFREKIVNGQILKQLAGFLGIFQTNSFSGSDDFHSTLLRIFEVFGQQSSIPLGYPDVFFQDVLPSLANLYRKNSSGDTRFLCLKIFFDVLVAYLDDIANSHSSDGHENHVSASHEDLRSIARQQFLPYYSSLLDDDDPIPMYAQKLLVMLLDVKCIGIEDILALKLLSQFFDFLHDDFTTVNLHNVRLCLFLASASEVKTSSLSELRISGRVGALIEFVHGRDMEDFLEPSLSLCKSLLIRCSTNEINGVKDERIKDIGEFVGYVNVFLELCCRHELQVAEVASECLILLMKVVPKTAGPVLVPKLPILKNALECCGSQGSNATSRMQRLLLLTLSAVCREQRTGHSKQQGLAISSSDSSALMFVVGSLRNSSSQLVADAAADAYLELEVLLTQT